MTAQPSYLDKTMHLAPSDQDVWGNERVPPSADDIDVGWKALHATERYEDGTPKGGAVYDVTLRDGLRRLAVVECREIRNRVHLRRYDWLATEVSPDTTYEMSSGEVAGYVVAMLRWGVQSFRRCWDYSDGDWLLVAIYALTNPGRVKVLAAKERSAEAGCAEGHCVEAGDSCAESRAHIGICCGCGTPVAPRRMR